MTNIGEDGSKNVEKNQTAEPKIQIFYPFIDFVAGGGGVKSIDW